MTRETQVRVWVIGSLAFLLILYVLSPVLLPFVAGAAVAYFLDPVADRLERLGLSRIMATIVITLGFIAVMALALILLVPVLQSQIFSFLDRLPSLIQGLVATVKSVLQHASDTLGPERMAKVTTAMESYAGEVAKWLVSFLRGVLTSGAALVNVFSILFITPVITFYLLRDWDKMVATINSWLPRREAPVIRRLAREIDITIAGFVRGQASVCLALGTFYAVGLGIAGLELGLVVGLMAGLLSFIPYVGTIVGFVASMGLAIAQYDDWQSIAAIAGIFVAGQVIEGNYLTPKLVGDRIGLHAVWVIFALMAGGSLFGFLGILLAVPVAAIIGVLARFGLRNYLDGPLYHGRAPDEEADPEPPPAPAPVSAPAQTPTPTPTAVPSLPKADPE